MDGFVDAAGNGAKRVYKTGMKYGKRFYRQLETTSIKETFNDVKRLYNDPTKMTWVQAVVTSVVLLVLGIVVLQKLAAYYQENLPELLYGLVKILLFIVIPVNSVAAVILGMKLQEKYHKMNDLRALYGDAREVVWGDRGGYPYKVGSD